MFKMAETRKTRIRNNDLLSKVDDPRLNLCLLGRCSLWWKYNLKYLTVIACRLHEFFFRSAQEIYFCLFEMSHIMSFRHQYSNFDISGNHCQLFFLICLDYMLKFKILNYFWSSNTQFNIRWPIPIRHTLPVVSLAPPKVLYSFSHMLNKTSTSTKKLYIF
jgi:hypothetical protein